MPAMIAIGDQLPDATLWESTGFGEACPLSPEAVSVKAKTGESVGEVGREEVMMAQCVALLTPRTSA